MQRVGIIGCGRIAQARHIPEYLENEQAQIAGFYDLNQDRAQQLADQYGCRAYSSIEEMLADPEIEAVIIGIGDQIGRDVTDALIGLRSCFNHTDLQCDSFPIKTDPCCVVNASREIICCRNQYRSFRTCTDLQTMLLEQHQDHFLFRNKGPQKYLIDKQLAHILLLQHIP